MIRSTSMQDLNLAVILRDVRTVGEVLSVPQRAEAVVASRRCARARCRRAPASLRAPRMDRSALPTGHWGPELVEIAGGVEPIGCRGADFPLRNAARCTWWTARPTFSRPGPRIADSLEILAEILHPESFRTAAPASGDRPCLLAGAGKQRNTHSPSTARSGVHAWKLRDRDDAVVCVGQRLSVGPGWLLSAHDRNTGTSVDGMDTACLAGSSRGIARRDARRIASQAQGIAQETPRRLLADQATIRDNRPPQGKAL